MFVNTKRTYGSSCSLRNFYCCTVKIINIRGEIVIKSFKIIINVNFRFLVFFHCTMQYKRGWKTWSETWKNVTATALNWVTDDGLNIFSSWSWICNSNVVYFFLPCLVIQQSFKLKKNYWEQILNVFYLAKNARSFHRFITFNYNIISINDYCIPNITIIHV